MENTDNKLESLISNLRQQKPELESAELFTDKIMNGIDRKIQRPKSYAMGWIRAVSSSAAVFLLGLFLFQQTEKEEVNSNVRFQYLPVQHINIDSLCIQNSKNKREIYFCYMQRNAYKNQQVKLFTKQSNN